MSRNPQPDFFCERRVLNESGLMTAVRWIAAYRLSAAGSANAVALSDQPKARANGGGINGQKEIDRGRGDRGLRELATRCRRAWLSLFHRVAAGYGELHAGRRGRQASRPEGPAWGACYDHES